MSDRTADATRSPWPRLSQVPRDVTHVISAADVVYRRAAVGWEFLGMSGGWHRCHGGLAFDLIEAPEVAGDE